jgi:hypothetical protein
MTVEVHWYEQKTQLVGLQFASEGRRLQLYQPKHLPLYISMTCFPMHDSIQETVIVSPV